ncbi:MAG TPA: DNA polymerase/3'-5' exonuclease PolX [Syntrophales bacterium]|nr:DNA polymerase/3'-5' exonuclease PolX [Syntrophales bacterium]HPI58003.1 DNA polymerase/3'-5' exonuclease PolX [Syntrophales bacterium]HPN25869.1 DNA polymerase/3'-5' exonuclease PolX [Syntrophales bacterium]HQM29575.1 DNA polymerase/3'-5' exonuclease PolX [Syntrophales bacterium]
MKNQNLAKMFYEIAEYLEMDGVPFKPYAYQKAATTLEAMKEDVEDVYRQGGIKALRALPGVGEAIAKKIEEYLTTGRLRYYEEFKEKMPIDLGEIIRVEGMGPRRAKTLFEKLGVRNLQELEKAARGHRIAPLAGFGEKTEKNILEAIEFLKRSKGRFLLGDLLPVAETVLEKLRGVKGVERADMAGSLRRMKETIGDVDFLVISRDPDRVMDAFVSLPGVEKIWGKGKTKSSVRMAEGYDMDVRVIAPESYGAALQYFTGSKEHNIALRKIAIDRGFKLSEYGLFKGSKSIAARTEEEIYRRLGLQWIPPEMREDRGEVGLAEEGRLPESVSEEDIRGDLHVHSDWDGGSNSIERIAEAARERGYHYVGIADHTKFLKIEHGLDEKKIRERNAEIDDLNEQARKSGSRFRILKGCEANIMNDGSIDISDDVLAELDFVIAGIHSHFKMARTDMTERIIRALKNPHVDILSHPTGRILKRRDEYEADFDRLLKVAREEGKVLEINAYPERLDLNDTNILKAVKSGVRMAVNTDAHHVDQLDMMRYGVAQARRGWACKKDIINTWPAAALLKVMK